LASVDVDWQMTGVRNPDGSPRPARKGLLSWIMAKQGDGSWLVEIMHMNEFTDTPARLAPAPAK
jgi:ketosteroid isomerase-like protein